MLSAEQISALERNRTNVKKETYRAMLEQFSRKIRMTYELGRREALLTIPPFIIGFPKYDLAKAVIYMSRQLLKLGYNVELVGPLDMRVTWAKAPPSAQPEEPDEPLDILPGLVNLQKTAQQLRKR